MNREYVVVNRDTGESRRVDAFSARDALYQVAGWRGLSIQGLQYRSGYWETTEPYPWWYELDEKEEDIVQEIKCECNQDYSLVVSELKLVSDTITCSCGLSIKVER